MPKDTVGKSGSPEIDGMNIKPLCVNFWMVTKLALILTLTCNSYTTERKFSKLLSISGVVYQIL